MVDQKEIHRKCNSDDPKERIEAVYQLRNRYEYLSDKTQVWQDLVRLTSDEDSAVRWKAARMLGTVFQYVPDKEKAWEDLHRLTLDQDNDMRLEAAGALDTFFQYVPDKEKAWEDLHRLTSDKDRYVRRKAARALGTNFQYVPDKEKAWEDLIKLASDKDGYTRREAVRALAIGFQYVPDKEKAWDDLVRLTLDKDSNVEWVPAWALGTVFQYVPDKEKAWEDLHRLTSDKYRYLRRDLAEALGTVIQYVPDKEKAWEDLHRLTSDRDSDVRQGATRALGTVFQYVHDKEKAWEDLHRLTLDKDSDVRRKAARALGTSFQYVPDKEKAWEDLHRLTSDKDSYARNNAYHSLGRISIYKASQSGSEEAYLEELKKAIEFFEKPAKESTGDNSSRFCFPFYRSFYTIISAKKQKAENEVVKYLSEAKNAIDGSENKKLLFETVENLANALKEVHNLENMDLEAKKGELNFYRKYCEQAAELMKNTEESAPSATLLIRKGLPILDRKLKSLLKEIQEKAKIACREAKGTDTEEIACAVSREVQKWEIGSQEEMTWYVENLVFTLESTIPRTPKNQHVFDRISQIREERNVIRQYAIVCTIIPLIPLLSMDEKVINIEQGISDLKIGLGEVNENTIVIIKKLDEIQEELKEGFEKLDKLSVKVGGKEGENIKIFSEKLLEMTKKGDSKAIERFLEELLKDESALIKEIDSSSAPKNEKEESKRSISKLRSLLEKVKNPTKAFGKDVTKEIVVGYAAKGIIDLVIPMMFLAVFGVPIPSHITEILAIVAKELKE